VVKNILNTPIMMKKMCIEAFCKVAKRGKHVVFVSTNNVYGFLREFGILISFHESFCHHENIY
jgi:hypothetical protein